MKTVEERIKFAEDRIRELKTRAQKLQAKQKFQLKKRSRAEDTRRKIVAGAVFLSVAANSDTEKKHIFSILSKFVTRPSDRELFEFDGTDDPENEKSL